MELQWCNCYLCYAWLSVVIKLSCCCVCHGVVLEVDKADATNSDVFILFINLTSYFESNQSRLLIVTTTAHADETSFCTISTALQFQFILLIQINLVLNNF